MSSSTQQGTPQEAEDTLKRIQAHRGVVGTIVLNHEGT